jgi:hypothetical protein
MDNGSGSCLVARADDRWIRLENAEAETDVCKCWVTSKKRTREGLGRTFMFLTVPIQASPLEAVILGRFGKNTYIICHYEPVQSSELMGLPQERLANNEGHSVEGK